MDGGEGRRTLQLVWLKSCLTVTHFTAPRPRPAPPPAHNYQFVVLQSLIASGSVRFGVDSVGSSDRLPRGSGLAWPGFFLYGSSCGLEAERHWGHFHSNISSQSGAKAGNRISNGFSMFRPGG